MNRSSVFSRQPPSEEYAGIFGRQAPRMGNESFLLHSRCSLWKNGGMLKTSGLSEVIEKVNRDLNQAAETTTKGLIT